jgi:hypothetical protein
MLPAREFITIKLQSVVERKIEINVRSAVERHGRKVCKVEIKVRSAVKRRKRKVAINANNDTILAISNISPSEL